MDDFQEIGDPIDKLYSTLKKKGYYTKSIGEFKQKYSSPESIDKLYEVVNRDGLYTKTKDDFYKQYYPTTVTAAPKKKEDTQQAIIGLSKIFPSTVKNLLTGAAKSESAIPSTLTGEDSFRPEQAEIDPSDPVKSYLQPDRDFLKQIRDQRRTVESVGQNQVEKMSISNMVNAAKQKEKEVIQSVFPTGKDAQNYLSQVIGVQDIDNVEPETIEKLTNPRNETQALAKDKYYKLRAVKDDIKTSNTFEQLALKQAARNGGVLKKQIDYLGESLPKNMKGDLILQLLNNPDLYEAAEDNPKLRAEIDDQTYALPERYPATALKHMAQLVSNVMEQKGIGNGILNVPSVATTTEIVNELVNSGALPENYLQFYNKKGVDKLVTSNLRTPGFIENALQSADKSLMNIGKTGAELTGIRSLYKDADDQTFDALAEQYQQVGFKPKGILHEISTSGGDLVGQVLPLMAGGSALRASKLLQSDFATNALMTGLQTYSYNLENARTQLPGESSWKQQGLALANTGVEMSLANVFNDMKFARGLTKKAAPEIRQIIDNFSNKSISSAAAKTQLNEVFDKLLTAGKSTVKTSVSNANEEAATELLQNTNNKLFGGEQLSDSENLSRAFDVWKTTFLGGLPSGLGGGIVKSMNDPSSGTIVYEVASNPEKYKKIINDFASIDEETEQSKDERIKNIDYASQVLSELDKRGLPEDKKAKYLVRSLNEKIIKEEAAKIGDPLLKKDSEKKLAELEISKKALLDPEMNNTKIVQEFFDNELLGKSSLENLSIRDEEGKPTNKFDPSKVGEYLKEAAQRLNNLDSDWQPNKAGDSSKAAKQSYPEAIAEIANERWEKEIEAAKPKVDLSTQMGEPEQISEQVELSTELPENYELPSQPEAQFDVNIPKTTAEPIQEQPTPTQEAVGELPPSTPTTKGPYIERPGTELKDLDILANNVPDSGKVDEYMSKGTIEKYTGETPTNDQTRGVQELEIALNHGEKIIEKSKEVFGSDYVEKTLEYIDNSTSSVSNKALMYVSLENALGREKQLATDERKIDLTKQQALVYEQSQKFARENSLALNYQKLRKIAKAGYDIEKITNNFFSAEEIEGKSKLKKAIEADADTINKAAEQLEVGGMTPEIEKAISEGVEKEINRIHNLLPKSIKDRANQLDKALEAVQKKLRSKTYEATLGIPAFAIDASITVIRRAIKLGASVAEAVEAGIKEIKKHIGDKKWEKEDEYRKDALDEFAKYSEKEKKSEKELVRNILIEKGFGREFTVKGENKKILDWKKLAGAAGTISKIRENVNEALKENGLRGLSDAKKGMIKEEFIKEYVDLRSWVIERTQSELAKRNKETITPEQKSAAKKLAELYTYGLFDSQYDTFETTLNKALGAKVSEKGFNEAKEIAKGLETLYSTSFKGVKLSDVSAKAAIEKLEDRLRVLLFREAKSQGNFALKAANLVRNYFEIQQTMILNNLKQAVENPFSGLQQNVIDKITESSNTTSEMATQRRKMMKDIYSDIVLKGGIGYGKVESQFVNRQHIDDYVNKLSDNQLYHGVMSVVTGKATLNAMDAMFKAGITEKKFTGNLIKILTHDTNPKKMSKKDAVAFVSEKLTGQNFIDAQTTAKEVMEKINKDAGSNLIPINESTINRLANDIVKASLEMGGKITKEQIDAAYGAAYKAAGLGLGHEANNPLSSTLKGYSAKLEGDINQAIKSKEWNRAAALTLKSVLFRNILNPFVGGGTNWLVLKLEKTGLGLFTGLAYKWGSKSDIDLSTESGMNKLEARLYNQSRAKDNFMRGLIGGGISLLTYGAFLSVASSDEYRKWRAKNPWAARYLDILTPEQILAHMAIENKQVKRYASSSFNRGDAFNSTDKLIKSVEYATKGESGKAWGALGEAVGQKLNAPLPWRLVKDGVVLYQGAAGTDPYHGNYKPSNGFMSGILQGGILEFAGVPRSVDSSTKSNKPSRPKLPKKPEK